MRISLQQPSQPHQLASSKFAELTRSSISLRGLSAALLTTASLLGCGDQAVISAYDSSASESRGQAMDPAVVADQLDHMFAAIVPAGNQAWFFKLVAKAPVATELSPEFRKFLATVDAKPGAALPDWQLPEGWTRGEAAPMRAATLLVPSDDGPLELTVSSLPISTEWANFVTMNVNRWMRQLQQSQLPASVIEDLAEAAPTRGAEATVFELAGVMQSAGPMSAAGMMGGELPPDHPPIGSVSAEPLTGGMPEGHGQAATAGDSSPPKSFQFDAPEGWKLQPPRSMREATFVAGSGDDAIELAVSKWPAVAAMADLRGNADRWAREAGIDPLDEATFEESVQQMRIAGLEGHFMDFLSDSADPAIHTVVGAMLPRGDSIWFFKMTGSAAAVDSQREAFRSFLDSVEFPAE